MDSDAWAFATSFKQALLKAVQSVADNMPSLIAALLIILAGWLLGRLARRVAQHLASGANRFLDRTLRHGSAASVRLSPASISVAGELAFWLVLTLALLLAAGVAGLGSIGQWVNQIVLHLPNLIVGGAIVVVGYFLSVYLREMVTSAARRDRFGGFPGLGQLVQWSTLAIALIVGLDQAGIDAAMLMIAFAIVTGGLVIGMVVPFAVGARDHVSNLIGARNARHYLHPGARLRIGDLEGELLEITPTHIALDTAEGRTLLPAKLLETQNVLIVTPGTERQTDDG